MMSTAWRLGRVSSIVAPSFFLGGRHDEFLHTILTREHNIPTLYVKSLLRSVKLLHVINHAPEQNSFSPVLVKVHVDFTLINASSFYT